MILSLALAWRDWNSWGAANFTTLRPFGVMWSGLRLRRAEASSPVISETVVKMWAVAAEARSMQWEKGLVFLANKFPREKKIKIYFFSKENI